MTDPRDTIDQETLRAQITLEVRSELRREWQQNHEQKQKALLALTRSAHLRSPADAFRRLTEVGAETLNVARVGIWLYPTSPAIGYRPSIPPPPSDSFAALRSEDLFEAAAPRSHDVDGFAATPQGTRNTDGFAAAAAGTHTAGTEILRSDYPKYFAALEENRAIVADDARTHPATSELAAPYLTPLGITSMLDATIRLEGRVIGVVCNEHVGPARVWNPEEISFASSLADLAAFIVEQRDLQRAEAVLRETEQRYAFHDALTGLPNRALFLDRAGRLLERAKRHKDSRFAVLAIDADRFKIINDSLGPHVGDRMLIALSRVLCGAIREGETVSRLDGDAFGVLIDDVRDSRDAIATAERIFAALTEPLREDGHEVFASVSIGIALSSADHGRAEDVLRDADAAMYRAKTRGRDRYELFDTTWAATARSSLHLYTELRHAINRRQFVLYYQPIISLDSGMITGLEALIRWRHPSRGMVPPGEFISVAEETGLIHAMGGWVLEEACTQAKWLAERFPDIHLDVSINLSPRQLARSEIVEDVRRALADAGLRDGAIHLEITESMLMENAQVAKDRLRQLRGLGVGLLIDDFGTGYSSLSALHTFPIDTLKIDQSFVGRLEDEEKYAAAIVEAIVAVARRLGIRVIAEGIETTRQLQAVRDHGCNFAQGYFFARPAPLEDFAALLDRSPRW